MKAIILTRGRIATVDDEDFDRVNQFQWHALKRPFGYHAARNLPHVNGKRSGYVYLHSFILGTRADHKNGDKLDCRRENLRPASQLENNRAFRHKSPGTSSVFRGVTWDSEKGKWAASIHSGGKRFHLGRFSDEADAARAYDVAARERFGEFAAPNFT